MSVTRSAQGAPLTRQVQPTMALDSNPSQTTSGSQRLVWRLPSSGQAQCTSRKDFAPFSSSTHRAFHGERAGKNDRGGLGDGCEIRSAKTRHNTNCIKQGNIKRAQDCCPWSPPQGGARDQSASARRGLPSKGEARALHHQPRPCIDLDHALPQLFSSHWRTPPPLSVSSTRRHCWSPCAQGRCYPIGRCAHRSSVPS
jgi:hypothetical protein